MKRLIKNTVKKLSYLKRVFFEIDQLRFECKPFQRGWPPGHFYSPIPSIEEVKLNEEKIFIITLEIPGVDLNEDGQLHLFNEIKCYSKE